MSRAKRGYLEHRRPITREFLLELAERCEFDDVAALLFIRAVNHHWLTPKEQRAVFGYAFAPKEEVERNGEVCKRDPEHGPMVVDSEQPVHREHCPEEGCGFNLSRTWEPKPKSD